APLHHGRKPEVAGESAPVEERADRKDGLDLQKAAGNSAVAGMLGNNRGDLVRSVVGSPGRPIDRSVVDMVRDATGDDASGIQVHEGEKAAEAARSVDAEMFASGKHIVAPSGLDVSTREGAFKTVHEVHHIVNQQAKGPVEGTDTGDGLKISDPGDRHEQEANRAAARAVRKHFGAGR
ncbi:MAG TPA: DUF4157 domain-containing protein, partial [Acidimicrobiales bacterium]|nr:DUF4157 domain-containing protein [Acidimicrobiales bacterium]